MSALKIFVIGVGIVFIVFIAIVSVKAFSFSSTQTYTHKDAFKVAVESMVPEVVKEEKEKTFHLETPDPVKSIYMTSCVVGTPSFREDLIALIEETELNSLVIDVKDFSGTLSFKPEGYPELMGAWEAAGCGTTNMKGFLEELHEKDIYTIARVTVFQDPYYAELNPEVAVQSKATGGLWSDRKGGHYLDPGSKEVWERTVAIAEASYNIGFDEINFDYIRYPSDGVMADIQLPVTGTKSRELSLESFFKYLHEEMEERGIPTSADLFGIVMSSNGDRETIGQVLERAAPYFDYIAPMVYPSHYPKGFIGYQNPNTAPYEIISHSLEAGAEKIEACEPKSVTKTVTTTNEDGTTTTKQVTEEPPKRDLPYVCGDRAILRPWLQDFDYGGEYGPAEVRAQIQATYDAGLTSWMLWAPSNRYTRAALESE